MKQERFSAPELQVGRCRQASIGSRRRRILLTAVAMSVAVHLGAILLAVLLSPVLSPAAPPREPGTVELLMVEQRGALSQASPGKQTAVPPAKTAETPTQPAPQAQAPSGSPSADAAPAPQEPGEEPAPPQPEQVLPSPASPGSRKADAQSRPPPQPDAPVFNLEGTESDSNAIALGPRILPAMPDNRFRNRPPAFPADAERRGQHGTVVVVIHVAENGSASGVDVMQSSGVEVLDQAAVAAVRKWRFHPAMRAGRGIPFDMPFRFVFEAD